MSSPQSMVLAVTFAASGCIGSPALPQRGDPMTADAPRRGGTVVTREDLRGQSGSLLSALARQVASMEIVPHSPCPSIELRGPSTARGITEPEVYVNGTRTTDTCMLVSLAPPDVERVEIYPTGVAPRAGYTTSAHGLILVFTRDGR